MKNHKNKQITEFARLIAKISMLLLILMLFVAAGDDEMINPMEELSSGDQKKLTEADELRSKADELVLKASGLYVDASNIRQSETYSPQSPEAKEAQKMEEEAMDNELSASDMYMKANNTKYAIYKNYINDFHKDFEGSESEISTAKQLEQIADESFAKSAGLREEGSNAKDHWVTFSKYQEANETEVNGIENLIAAYNAYKAWPEQSSYTADDGEYTETSSYAAASATTAGVVSYEESPSTSASTSTYDPYATDYSSYSTGTDDYSSSYTPTEDYSSTATTSSYTEPEPTYTTTPTTTVSAIEETPATSSTSTYSNTSDYQSYSGSPTPSYTATSTTAPTYNASVGAGVVFAVQVCAVVAPLTPEQKQRVYDGPETLTEQAEGIWYKYQVVIGSDYEEAKRFASSCGVKGAFVVAYRDGQKIKLSEAFY